MLKWVELHMSKQLVSFHFNLILLSICDYMAQQKPAMFTHRLKFILLVQPIYVATLNNYAWSLPPLANVNWSSLPECFH